MGAPHPCWRLNKVNQNIPHPLSPTLMSMSSPQFLLIDEFHTTHRLLIPTLLRKQILINIFSKKFIMGQAEYDLI